MKHIFCFGILPFIECEIEEGIMAMLLDNSKPKVAIFFSIADVTYDWC